MGSKSERMTQVVVGRWGKNLAVRVPNDLAGQSGLIEGEAVEIEIKDGDILIRRPGRDAAARAEARAAADKIISSQGRYQLDVATILNYRDEGRRG